MTDAILIAFVKDVLFKDPDIIAKYGNRLAAMQQNPAENTADFSDVLDNPLSPPNAEKHAERDWVPTKIPVDSVTIVSKTMPSSSGKAAIVRKTTDAAANRCDKATKTVVPPASSTKSAIVPRTIDAAATRCDKATKTVAPPASSAKPAIVHRTIDAAAAIKPTVPSTAQVAIVSQTIEATNDGPEEMDTTVPISNSSSDSELSEDASSSEDGYKLVSSGGKRKKTSKALKANKAKKQIASTDSPTPSTSTAPISQASRRPLSPSAPASASQKKQRPPPPLYIQDKSKWTDVSKMCSDRRINYTNAKACALGIKVLVPTSNDYRDLVHALRERKISFHTYTLPEDTPTRVVIRRIPKEISTEDIKNDLIAQSVPVSAVHRLHKARGGDLYDMILVVCDPTEGHHPIYKVKSVCSLSGISIEKPFRPTIVGQCHRCQLYGHSQRNCFATPRCVKCLGDHGTSECPRPKDPAECTEPPSCVLCGQSGHPANYRGCPKAPKIAPKLAKRAIARQQRESPSERLPTSQIPERLAPQRPSPWNQLNHQKAFPALVASPPQPIPAQTAKATAAPTHAPATQAVPEVPQPAPQRTTAPVVVQARPTPPTTKVDNHGVSETILEAYGLFMTRAARAMSKELNTFRGNDGQLQLSTRKALEIFTAYKSITDKLDAMDALDD